MYELNGELSWETAEYVDDDTGEELDQFSDSQDQSDIDDGQDDYVSHDESLDLAAVFSARKATQLLLKKYPDAFKYDPKSMTLDKFLADKGLTEFGWLYLQMLAYSVSGKYYRNEDQNSLNTLAVSDCAAWLDGKVRFFTGKISNLRAILYTRIRNTMSNNLYKDNRFLPTEDTVLDLNAYNDKSIQTQGVSDEVLDYVFNNKEEAHAMTLKIFDLSRGITKQANKTLFRKS
jgi:hypothetical protein